MGKDIITERVTLGAGHEIDALVGRFVTGENPETHWEDSHAQLRFDSIEEALEALREPYFQQFIPADERANTVLREVREFRPYSTDLSVAWEVVEKITDAGADLRLQRDCGSWKAAFGNEPPVSARTAPLCICLAALRMRAVEVEFMCETASEVDSMHRGSLDSAQRSQAFGR
ncbi:MAG: Phage sandwich domain [Chthoniobacter sp.]|jgi:hypothetical protein|nr:Phage sandwich domain [Chthoniobacter sp.]